MNLREIAIAPRIKKEDCGSCPHLEYYNNFCGSVQLPLKVLEKCPKGKFEAIL